MPQGHRSQDAKALAVVAPLLVAWALIGSVIAGHRGEQEPFDPVATFGIPGLGLIAYVVAGLLAPSRPFRVGLLLGLRQVGPWWLQWIMSWPMTGPVHAPRELEPVPGQMLLLWSLLSVATGVVIVGLVGRASRR